MGHTTPATLRLMERCLSFILLAVPATATATTFGAEFGSDVFKQKWEALVGGPEWRWPALRSP